MALISVTVMILDLIFRRAEKALIFRRAEKAVVPWREG